MLAAVSAWRKRGHQLTRQPGNTALQPSPLWLSRYRLSSLWTQLLFYQAGAYRLRETVNHKSFLAVVVAWRGEHRSGAAGRRRAVGSVA